MAETNSVSTARRCPVRVAAITSGKGGVGKTSVSVNLGIALSGLGKRVMLLDADLGLANVDVVLGLKPRMDLGHVLRGECGLKDIVLEGPKGLRIVPGSSGLKGMTELSIAEHAGMIDAFNELAGELDVLLVDTQAGISDNVVVYSRAAQEVIVVVCDEPASLADAYALIKVLSRDYQVDRFHVLANMVSAADHGLRLYEQLLKVTDRFLALSPGYLGAVPQDHYLRKAIQRRQAVVDAFPLSKAALAFKALATKIASWPAPERGSGYLEFFVEQLGLPSAPAGEIRTAP
jgi:flagellar biosynthesis protein FlhG